MIRISTREAARWFTFDAPDRLNAFTATGYHDLRVGIEEASTDPEVRVLVLTGTGRAFSAGADRSLFDGSASPDESAAAGEEFAGLLEALDSCDKPVLVAVNGLGVGFGCTILLHCDLVLLAESARLRLPFAGLGLAPEAGSSVLLPARARWADAAWALYSGDWIDATTAVGMGLAWRAVPDDRLIAETEAAAATIAANDPAAVAAAKRLLLAGRAETVRAAMDRELAEMAALLGRGTE